MRSLKVVGVGASAGGIEALKIMLQRLKPDCGFATIVLLHLPPHGNAILASILARDCSLPVHTAIDGDRVELGHVYVTPPGVGLTIAGDRIVFPQKFELTPHDHHPIDALFLSLANNYGAAAAGILLSGSGSDGTLGAEAIQAAGGLTIAQGSGASQPLFPDMPASAIAAACIDEVLPAEAIADHLAGLAAVACAEGRVGAHDGPHPQQDEASLAAEGDAICDILRRETDHDFSGYKTLMFFRRVRRRARMLNISSLPEYINRLQHDADEVRALRKDLLISVTAFFRDAEVFDALARECIPRLFEGKTSHDTVRVWVPACASGEEAFSIAMLLQEEADRHPFGAQWQIFATDVDEFALKTARQGQYTRAQVAVVSPKRRERFFEVIGNDFRISKKLREQCLFSSHNLMNEPPFSRIDMISCRNFLIYINTQMQDSVFNIFYFALRPSGYLLLGGSESAINYSHLFRVIDSFHHLYRRRDHAVLSQGLPQFRISAPRSVASGSSGQRLAATAPNARQSGEAMVLARFAPPHVVADRNGEILHFSLSTSAYLAQPPGQPTRSLFALAAPKLLPGLRVAFQEAIRTESPATRIVAGVSITATRIAAADAVDPLFLVVFAEAPGPITPLPAPAASALAASPTLARDLDNALHDLRQMQDEQKARIAEQDSITQELALVNEELQFANQEMEVSKEELQSLNEELVAVNSDMRSKINELNRILSDQHNIFELTELCIIILDKNLSIRSMTPACERLLKLTKADIRIPFHNISHKIKGKEVENRLRSVLFDQKTVEIEVILPDCFRKYLLRLAPYKNLDDQIDGVLLNFVDITDLLEVREEQEKQLLSAASARASRAELDLILSAVPVVVFRGYMNTDGRAVRQYVSRNIEQLTGLSLGLLGDSPFVDGDGEVEARLEGAERWQLLLRDGEWEGEESYKKADGTPVWIRSSFRLLSRQPDGGGEIVGYLVDVSREKQARAVAAGRDRLASLGEMSAGLGHEINQPLQAITLIADSAQMAARRTGTQEFSKAFDDILQQTGRIGEIIRHLRTFARGSDPTKPLAIISLRTAIEGTLSLVGETLKESDIAIELCLDEALPAVMGHLVAIEQVLTNLLLNARDALVTKPIGQKRFIRLTSSPGVHAGEIRLRIADNGGGIAPEVLSRLFEPFVTSKGPDHGTGLGLSICHGMLRSMGGSIQGENDADGAVFTLTFVADVGGG